jgi:formate--tetrahydrofolate ligase
VAFSTVNQNSWYKPQSMKSDIEIAQSVELKPIKEIAKMIGIEEDELLPYGKHVAKVPHQLLGKLKDKPNGKLIIVTAITPTPAGEGKTTTSVGLAQGMNRIGKKAIVTLREPSLGPVFGIKGGAAGGGYAQVLPMEDINLHFTGDMHAVSAAHNLLSAMIDAHIHNGNDLDIDVRRITWPRAIDMNDRALRHIVISLGGKGNGFPREDRFVITAASEIMAILCLANDISDLKKRLANIVIGQTRKGKYVTAGQLKAEGAMAALLRDAINPNLVQTIEHTPAFVHGGPFANIAHGTNTIVATKLALKLADYVITETGFAADLGGEKFFDVVSKYANLKPDTVVLVATIRALKMHGGMDKKELKQENLEALKKGLENLKVHIENVKKFGLPVVVALNKFESDTDAELKIVEDFVKGMGVRIALNEAWAKGGAGAEELAKEVVESTQEDGNDFHQIYDWEAPIKEKIEILAKEIYRAGNVVYTSKALSDIRKIEKEGKGNLPIIMAKTQASISDDPKVIGAPSGYTFTIREVFLSNGAGFIVPIAGEIMTMPGLPKVPAAQMIDVDEDGKITGLF